MEVTEAGIIILSIQECANAESPIESIEPKMAILPKL